LNINNNSFHTNDILINHNNKLITPQKTIPKYIPTNGDYEKAFLNKDLLNSINLSTCGTSVNEIMQNNIINANVNLNPINQLNSINLTSFDKNLNTDYTKNAEKIKTRDAILKKYFNLEIENFIANKKSKRNNNENNEEYCEYDPLTEIKINFNKKDLYEIVKPYYYADVLYNEFKKSQITVDKQDNFMILKKRRKTLISKSNIFIYYLNNNLKYIILFKI
jgi:hypothetical protein